MEKLQFRLAKLIAEHVNTESKMKSRIEYLEAQQYYQQCSILLHFIPSLLLLLSSKRTLPILAEIYRRGCNGRRNNRGDGSEKERQKAVFELKDKASLKNCIIGAASGAEGSADGVHCTGGGCDVTMFVTGGGAKDAADKVMQFNGKGTATIKNFWVDTFTRFIRTCGNCENQYKRTIVISNLTAINGASGQFIAGINFNYGDSATLTQIKLGGSTAKKVNPCKRFVVYLKDKERPSPMELILMENIASIRLLTLPICHKRRIWRFSIFCMTCIFIYH
uniref:Probable pectate lyase F n=1 Tax=Ditylenchus dipsaci TaxID=166011 RepID=A0A915EGI2_9BILA